MNKDERRLKIKDFNKYYSDAEKSNKSYLNMYNYLIDISTKYYQGEKILPNVMYDKFKSQYNKITPLIKQEPTSNVNDVITLKYIYDNVNVKIPTTNIAKDYTSLVTDFIKDKNEIIIQRRYNNFKLLASVSMPKAFNVKNAKIDFLLISQRVIMNALNDVAKSLLRERIENLLFMSGEFIKPLDRIVFEFDISIIDEIDTNLINYIKKCLMKDTKLPFIEMIESFKNLKFYLRNSVKYDEKYNNEGNELYTSILKNVKSELVSKTIFKDVDNIDMNDIVDNKIIHTLTETIDNDDLLYLSEISRRNDKHVFGTEVISGSKKIYLEISDPTFMAKSVIKDIIITNNHINGVFLKVKVDIENNGKIYERELFITQKIHMYYILLNNLKIGVDEIVFSRHSRENNAGNRSKNVLYPMYFIKKSRGEINVNEYNENRAYDIFKHFKKQSMTDKTYKIKNDIDYELNNSDIDKLKELVISELSLNVKNKNDLFENIFRNTTFSKLKKIFRVMNLNNSFITEENFGSLAVYGSDVIIQLLHTAVTSDLNDYNMNMNLMNFMKKFTLFTDINLPKILGSIHCSSDTVSKEDYQALYLRLDDELTTIYGKNIVEKLKYILDIYEMIMIKEEDCEERDVLGISDTIITISNSEFHETLKKLLTKCEGRVRE